MNDDVGGREIGLVVADDASEELPLGGSHRPLDEMILGVYLVRHDEARIDDDRRFF